MDLKEEQNSFYDNRLEPDIILVDSDDSNASLSITISNNSSPQDYSLKEKDMPVENGDLLKIRTTPNTRDDTPLQQCPTCKKFFKRLSSHILTHEENKNDPSRPFPCSFCPKVFKNLSNLTVHTRSHTGFRPYVCDICTKGFTQSGNLVHHLRIHTGSKPYKCPVCERAFTQPGNLANHMRLHSQEKPFQCHLCDRSFTQSSNLNSHLKNNHREITQQTSISVTD